MSNQTATDSLGVSMRVGDHIIVSAWGAPVRLIDTGKRATVVSFTRSGNVVLDTSDYPDGIANGRAVSPGYLHVLRRDGQPGLEGNRPRCICDATAFRACSCGVGPEAFEAKFTHAD